MTKKTRTRLASKTVAENPRAPRARIAEGDTDKLSARDVYGIHIPQLGRQGRAGPLRVCELIALVRYLHAVDAVHSSEKCTDADRLLVTLDGLPRLLAALSGVHEYIWAGATIDDAIAAATQYFQTRFKGTDIRAELAAADDALHALLEQARQWSDGVFD